MQAELAVMPTRTKQPDGDGWEPWTAASAPDAELWVNEERREILIVEGGAERRIGAPDATSFALEVADVERYYGASPRFGTRDSCELLRGPASMMVAPREPWFRSALASFRKVRLLAPRIGPVAKATAEAAVYFGASFALIVAVSFAGESITESRDADISAWKEWANRNGSNQLRDMLQENAADKATLGRVFERDIAHALTPELVGATPCPGGVTYDSTVDFAYDAARSVFVRARAASEENARQFPAGSSVTAKPPVGCWMTGGTETGTCVPVELRRGEYVVATCYVIAK